jgi:hypothetical protein
MGENFMSAKMRIDELAGKIGQIAEKTASLLYDAINNRISSSGSVSPKAMENDIRNMLTEMPKDIREDILIKTIVLMSMNAHTNAHASSGGGKKRSSDRSSIFRNY